MNRKIVGIGVGMAIMLAASTAVRAQNSPAGAGIDAALRGAVERKDVPGVVALVIDVGACSIKAPSAWQTSRPGARSRPTRCSASPR